MNAEAAKRQFLEYIEIERGRAVKTIENYDHYLSRFFEQMQITDTSDISEEKIREFRLWLNRQAGVEGSMKKRTQNYYLIALRAFLRRESELGYTLSFCLLRASAPMASGPSLRSVRCEFPRGR